MDLRRLYRLLRKQYGPQAWWSAQVRGYEARCFEICVGAILTQNTNWKNVEKALGHLRSVRGLSLARMRTMQRRTLASLIRPSGYYNQKALKLQAFCTFVITEYGSSFRRMFREPTMALREKLLGVHGIGKETADSILLYAGQKPIFVIDSYTKRLLAGKGIVFKEYDEYREWFEKRLRRNVKLYQEFHALIVAAGKTDAPSYSVASIKNRKRVPL